MNNRVSIGTTCGPGSQGSCVMGPAPLSSQPGVTLLGWTCLLFSKTLVPALPQHQTPEENGLFLAGQAVWNKCSAPRCTRKHIFSRGNGCLQTRRPERTNVSLRFSSRFPCELRGTVLPAEMCWQMLIVSLLPRSHYKLQNANCCRYWSQLHHVLATSSCQSVFSETCCKQPFRGFSFSFHSDFGRNWFCFTLISRLIELSWEIKLSCVF